jgi:hypothetical protein
MREPVQRLAYAPLRVYADRASDIALLDMASDFWTKLDVVALEPRARQPMVEEPVKVWGFPDVGAVI